jgi:hypothetical protein
MARAKFDIVIETVRYTPEGEIEMVRAFERRGAAFSDHVLIAREALLEKIKSGKKCFTGQRTERMAGTFEADKSVRVQGDFISTGASATRDFLENVPVF